MSMFALAGAIWALARVSGLLWLPLNRLWILGGVGFFSVTTWTTSSEAEGLLIPSVNFMETTYKFVFRICQE